MPKTAKPSGDAKSTTGTTTKLNKNLMTSQALFFLRPLFSSLFSPLFLYMGSMLGCRIVLTKSALQHIAQFNSFLL